MQAPGVGIYSTVPNGSYKSYNGTSMAAPLVAGGVSALLHAKPYASQEMLWGDLINTAGNHVDFMACYEAGEPPVQLQFVTYELNDTLGGDGDYRPDAGETIDFYPTLRTTWGATDNINMWLEVDEYENPDIVEFLDADPVSFGHSLSAYAKSKSANPLRFTVNPECVDGRNINMELHAVATAGMNYAPVVTIGQGTTTNNYLPFNTHYSYSISQILFKANELTASGLVAGAMNSLSFQTNSTLGYTRNNISIWMANVSQNEVNNTSISTQGMACVYSGSMTQVQGWNDFAFNGTDFSWDGTSNVLITVVMNHGSYNSSIPWLCSNPGFKACAYNYSNNTSYNPSNNTYTLNSTSNYRPNIKFNAAVANGGEPTELVVPFTIQVENGVEIGGMITQDLTLYPNTHYIVTSNLAVPSGVTLTLKPGVILRFKDNTGFACSGTLVAHGTPDSLIVFSKAELGSGQVNPFSAQYTDTVKYAKFEYLYFTQREALSIKLENCILENITTQWGYGMEYQIISSNIKYWYSTQSWSYNNDGSHGGNFGPYTNITNSNIRGVNLRGRNFPYITSFRSCNILNNKNNEDFFSALYYSGSPSICSLEQPCYFGSTSESIVRQGILDMYQGNGYGYVDLSNMPSQPYAEAHGIVWKVVVNGYDAQDEFEQMPPLGCGTHEFKVYFNRPMDTSITPMVAMGVRPPYTQHAIADNGSWNDEGTVFTAYLTIDGTTVTDGLNRIYVANAKDNEHFEIPVENIRFNVQVASAGSLSNEFMATPGLGKVELEWNNNEVDFEDFLGYNMYRASYDTTVTYQYGYHDGHYEYYYDTIVSFDTIRINNMLIQDTLFTDYDVVPGTRYWYYYKVLRTNLTEGAASLTVTTVPLTSTPGDANGSMAVDVADVVSIVSYLTNGNPQPFIFEAADVNGDGNIDILDIVGVINIITNRGGLPDANPVATAYYSIEDGILFVDTPVELGGVQFVLNGIDSQNIEALQSLEGFEQVKANVSDGTLFMAYSMSGKRLPAGKHALLRIGEGQINTVALSDPEGHNVLAILSGAGVEEHETLFLEQPYPNPFNGNLTIPFIIADERVNNVVFTVTNIMGQTVSRIELGSRSRGEYKYEWSPSASMATGIYTVSMQVNGRNVQRAKVVYVN